MTDYFEAKEQGFTHYTPSTPCKRCGTSKRYVTAHQCVFCHLGYVTRQNAFEQGEKYYRTGETCKNGHRSKRYVSSGQCVQCKRNATKKVKRKVAHRNKSWEQICQSIRDRVQSKHA